MKKILLFLFLLPLCSSVLSQDIDKNVALKLVSANSYAIGLSEHDLKNFIISNAYVSNPSKIEMVYLQQTHMGVPLYNQLIVLAFKNGSLVSKSGSRVKGIENKISPLAPVPAITPDAAVMTALSSKKYAPKQTVSAIPAGSKFDFGKLGVAQQNITAELLWLPLNDGKQVKLVWQVYFVPNNTPDYWVIRVDAVQNKVIDENNLTVYCNWKDPAGTDVSHDHSASCTSTAGSNQNKEFKSSGILPALQGTEEGPSIINGASYRVIPYPAESPRHAGGNHALVTDPWNAAAGNATTLKWHSNGTSDFNMSRGNNVWAQEDMNANNGTGIPATSTTPDPLSFNFTPNFNVSPTQTAPVQNQQFSITNLFYWNNIIHDITYLYGFDEAAGNFQANNLGRGGAQNDFVFADAHDGNYVAPNQDNANFSTPADGTSGRMQMYLWDTTARLTVNTPASIAGIYTTIESGFSTANKLINVGPVTADVVYYNDNAATTHDACVTPSNGAALAGKIALINRGNCDFVLKVKNAQNAGAVGVIMVNNIPGALVLMGGSDNTITIPAVFVSDIDGALLAAQLGNNLNVTLAANYMDGSMDNGIMVHEYGHGISNRLTGGPAQSGCVANAEQMGEGWSDYYALMLTQDWATSNVNTGFTTPRALGTYAVGQAPTGPGIRTQRYSTDFTVNNLVFTTVLPGTGQQHTRGELWAATLWDMTWNIIQQTNNINPNIYNVAGGGGNVIALRLVTEAMKLQPCGPGFIDGRNAILQADQLLYGGAYSCAIKEAFRRRGMGTFASQGSANSTTDQIPDFSASLTVSVSPSVVQVPEGQNIVYTNTVSTCSPVTNYLLTDTLPSNVTYVSGGTYNAATRVVSFPVNLTLGQTQTYTFTVSVNTGTYFPTTTLFDEVFATTSLPGTLTQSSTTATAWTVTSAQSHSIPNSVFSANIATPSEQILTTASGLPLGSTPTQLSFWHLYNTEAGYDGGVVEISTDGGSTWNDLGVKMNLNRYNSTIDATAGTVIAGRPAFTGNSSAFIKTSVNLTSYTNQTARFRWRFVSDDGTAGVGWYVDDINVKSEPLVHMRSSVFNASNVRMAFSDTVTLITQVAVCTNVSITTQPVNANACTGTNATFTVTAAGTAPSYQWQVSTDGGTNWVIITGATTATLTVSSVTASMNNNRYRVIINNTCPSTVTSAAAILTVSTAAAITAQPLSVTTCSGDNATFTVTATGTNISYQWQVSTNGGGTFVNIPGASAANLTLTAVTASMNANQYHVVITGCNATPVTSSNVTLTVNATAAITSSPVNTNACTGGSATFTVAATGTAITYQWQLSTDGGAIWNNIAGATSASLTLNPVTSGMNNYRYRVVVSNACPGSATSTAATLTVSDPAAITSQPSGTTVCSGTNASFSVTATGTNITYQWQVSIDGGTTFTNVPGATAATITLTGVNAAQNGHQYRVVVFSCSATGLNSTAATLTVNTAPAISAQPANLTACTGNNAVFSVTATGTALTYQWQVSTDGGATFSNITGATSASLTVPAVTLAMNNNRYRVLINGSCPGALTSTAAILTVTNSASITTQPSNVTTCSGSSITFTATASGSAYQWQVSTDGGGTWNNITGATSTTLSLTSVTGSMNNNQYRLVVSSCVPGGLNSNPAALTVNNVAAITTQPANATACTGTGASFSVTATGTGISYQWQVSTDGGISFTNIAGATAATLNLTNLSASANNSQYRVIVSNNCPSSVTSAAAVLTVNNSPVINTQPAAAITCAGANATFTVTATSVTPTYQWQVSTDGGNTYNNIPGATTASLLLTNVTASMNNNSYRVVVTGCGSSNSNAALLTVNPLPQVVITAAPGIRLLAGNSTTLTATTNVTGGTFNWLHNSVPVPGASGNSIVVTYNSSTDLGTYTATYTDANNCTGVANGLLITDSSYTTAFIYPNPNRGNFSVRYNVGNTPLTRMISVFDSKGSRVFVKAYVGSPTEAMEVDLNKMAAGIYMVELSDEKGNRLAKGKVIIQ